VLPVWCQCCWCNVSATDVKSMWCLLVLLVWCEYLWCCRRHWGSQEETWAGARGAGQGAGDEQSSPGAGAARQAAGSTQPPQAAGPAAAASWLLEHTGDDQWTRHSRTLLTDEGPASSGKDVPCVGSSTIYVWNHRKQSDPSCLYRVHMRSDTLYVHPVWPPPLYASGLTPSPVYIWSNLSCLRQIWLSVYAQISIHRIPAIDMSLYRFCSCLWFGMNLRGWGDSYIYIIIYVHVYTHAGRILLLIPRICDL